MSPMGCRRAFLQTAIGASLVSIVPRAGHAADVVMVRKDQITVPPAFSGITTSARRPDADRKRDPFRKPAETMAFFGLKLGMTVAELMTSNGYFTGVLAEAVGDSGKVYGVNNQWMRERFKDTARPLGELITKGGYKNIVEINAELESPELPANAFDAIFVIWFYHDFYWMGIERPEMNKAIMAALKPGGIYGIIDHHGAPGIGIGDVAKNHRIEKSVVVEDIVAAGFELVEETDLLANPRDPMNVSVFQQELRGSTNQFVLKFRKPA